MDLSGLVECVPSTKFVLTFWRTCVFEQSCGGISKALGTALAVCDLEASLPCIEQKVGLSSRRRGSTRLTVSLENEREGGGSQNEDENAAIACSPENLNTCDVFAALYTQQRQP